MADKHRRPPFINRPWIKNSVWQRLSRDGIIHADLYAYAPAYFTIDWYMSGRKVLAQDCFDARLGVLDPCNGPSIAPALYWSHETRNLFAPVHAALMRYVWEQPPLPDERKRVVLCHYIMCPDTTPWPRGWANHYGAKALPAMPDVL